MRDACPHLPLVQVPACCLEGGLAYCTYPSLVFSAVGRGERWWELVVASSGWCLDGTSCVGGRMPDASPLWGVMEPGYTPAGKQTNIAGLWPLPRDGCGQPRSWVSAYGRKKNKKGNQQGCVNRRLGTQTKETMILFCSFEGYE